MSAKDSRAGEGGARAFGEEQSPMRLTATQPFGEGVVTAPPLLQNMRDLRPALHDWEIKIQLANDTCCRTWRSRFTLNGARAAPKGELEHKGKRHRPE